MKKIEVIDPVDTFVIVRPHDSEKVTAGGIHLPDRAQAPTRRGVVLSIGSGVPKDAAIDPDDVVTYGQFAGQNVELAQGTVRALRWNEIVGVVFDGGENVASEWDFSPDVVGS